MRGSWRRNSKAAVVEDCQGCRLWKWGTMVKGFSSGKVGGSAESGVGLGWRTLWNSKSLSRFEMRWLMASIFGGGRAKV